MYLDDSSLCKEKIKLARRVAKKFDYSRVKKLHKEFYEEIGFI
jgi:hypothetical protein